MKDEKDKKKIVIIGVLAVAVLGIGAWQFSSAKSTPGSKSAKESAKSASQSEPTRETIVADLDMIGLKRRNPFQPSALAEMQPTQAESTTVVAPPQASSNGARPSGPRGSSITPDISKYPFTFDGEPSLTPGVELTPGTPLRSPNEFTYSLVGVVDGPRPVAVFRGDDGTQRMVRLNESVGSNNSKVVGIQNGQVKVQHNGKTITLSVGGN